MRLLQLLASGFYYLSCFSPSDSELPTASVGRCPARTAPPRAPSSAAANYDGLMMTMMTTTLTLMLIKYGRTAPSDVIDTAKMLGLSLSCHLSMMR